MFDFLKPKCPVCGMKDNGTFVSKFGKKFCSQEHASEFEKKLNEKATELEKGSCCG